MADEGKGPTTDAKKTDALSYPSYCFQYDLVYKHLFRYFTQRRLRGLVEPLFCHREFF